MVSHLSGAALSRYPLAAAPWFPGQVTRFASPGEDGGRPARKTLTAAVTVVSPNNYFSFTPFLASTCVGTLEFRAATEAVRKLKDVNYAQGWADKIGECGLRTVAR